MLLTFTFSPAAIAGLIASGMLDSNFLFPCVYCTGKKYINFLKTEISAMLIYMGIYILPRSHVSTQLN